MRQCLVCEVEFTPWRKDQLICSAECARTPRGKRIHSIRRKFGISITEFDEMLAKQAGGCAICGERVVGQDIAVDHDHTTGKVRGLLCNRCNPGLGMFLDDPELLKRAAEYIEKEGRNE